MKSSLKEWGDNLYYEYLVGQFVNTLITRFPCFLETYGGFLYDDKADWAFSKDNKNTPKKIYQQMKHISKHSNNYFPSSCIYSKYFAVLIQSIPDATDLYDKLHLAGFLYNHLLYVLFNVYMPLACLKNQFTHYDLHPGNVLLYKTPPGEYIQYNYFTKHGNISFKSPYIVKIIDYGRCYFKYDSNDTSAPKLDSSRTVYDAVCKVKACDPNCGKNFGYQWLKPKGKKEDNISNLTNRKKNIIIEIVIK
jgi:hypothetical protein